MQRQVIILAGGLGTRMYPKTKTIPKVLLPVLGRPFIFWQLDLLAKNKIESVVLCVGFLGEKIEKSVGNNYCGVNINYSYEESHDLLGTAGAIRNAESQLESSFGVLYGDSYLELDYNSIFYAHYSSGLPATMTVWKNKDKYDISNVSLSHNKKLVACYNKKNREMDFDYIDYGFSIINKEVIVSRIKSKEFFDLSDLNRDLSSENILGAFEINKRFYEIGSEIGLEELENYLNKN